MTFRICHPNDFKDLHQYDVEERQFTGTMKKFTEEMRNEIVYFMKNKLNVTVEIHPNFGIGVYNSTSQRFDGCLGRLQANESDVLLMLDEYPINAENITEGMIIYDTKLVINQLYGNPVNGSVVQILSSFGSFSVEVWFLCIFFFSFLNFSFKLNLMLKKNLRKKYRNNRNKHNIYWILTHCFRVGRMPSSNIFEKILFIMGSIHALVVVHYFITYIKTELVVIKDPDLFYTYKDLIDQKIVPFFMSGMPFHKHFRDDDSNPKRRELWNYAVETFGEENLFAQIDPFGLMTLPMKLLKRKAVIIQDTLMSRFARGMACNMLAKNPKKLINSMAILTDQHALEALIDAWGFSRHKEKILKFSAKHLLKLDRVLDFRYYQSIDPSETKFPIGIITSSNSDKIIMKNFYEFARLRVETGYHISLFKRTDQIDLLDGYPGVNEFTGKKLSSRFNIKKECFSETVVKSEAQYKSIQLKNLETLLVLIIGINCILFYVLLYEVIIVQVFKKKV